MSICITSYIVWIKQLQDKLKRSWSVYSTSVNTRGKYMPFFAPPSIQLIFVQFFVTYTKVDLFLNSCNSWIELKWEWLETKKFCADLWKMFWWKTFAKEFAKEVARWELWIQRRNERDSPLAHDVLFLRSTLDLLSGVGQAITQESSSRRQHWECFVVPLFCRWRN